MEGWVIRDLLQNNTSGCKVIRAHPARVPYEAGTMQVAHWRMGHPKTGQEKPTVSLACEAST
eukprot:6733102-Pyramimonas_sp.AAC.1